MTKYIFKPSEKELSIGDTISLTIKSDDDIKTLSSFGLVEEVEDVEDKKIITDPYHYYNIIATKLGFKGAKDSNFVDVIAHLILKYPIAVYDIILKELAVAFDAKYEDHIKDSKELWTISKVDYTIGKIIPSDVKDYSIIPLFRTKEDAERAKSMLDDIIPNALRNAYK